ncbi:hypothetical protein [Streptomyces sp. uw30]|uniref:hypothetical protein n=1 Tax=Streptomyces sp. uw30 TaxID=1828179 RepID=UPI001650EDA6|nr:hypothetical protein [Streptomyces sp. uw30]
MAALNDPIAANLARRGALILNIRLGSTHPQTENAFALANRLLRRDSRQAAHPLTPEIVKFAGTVRRGGGRNGA